MTNRTPVKTERNAEIVRCRADGMTILGISRKFRISEARVTQILKPRVAQTLKTRDGLTTRPVKINLPGEFESVGEVARAYGVNRATVYRWIGRGVATCLALLPAIHCGHAETQEQMSCAQLAELAAGLAEHYGEKPVAMGLQPNGQLLEIFASPDSGTWTALTTSPAGLACVVATGKGWQQGAPGDPS